MVAEIKRGEDNKWRPFSPQAAGEFIEETTGRTLDPIEAALVSNLYNQLLERGIKEGGIPVMVRHDADGVPVEIRPMFPENVLRSLIKTLRPGLSQRKINKLISESPIYGK